MGKSCCENKATELAVLQQKQAGVLKAVLFINAVMFAVELTGGLFARSTALMADSLDMFGDASVYAFSLYALHKGARWKARAGYTKGLVMALFAAVVLGQALYRFFIQATPEATAMGLIGTIALVANLFCLILLYRHRTDDINMRSTWLCSRNDIIANIGVLCASWLVAAFQSGLPDLLVGAAIAGLFLWSSKDVISEARQELSSLKGKVAQTKRLA